MISVGGVLLAAGRTSRMAGGKHKLLAALNGETLARKTAMVLLNSQIASVFAITGHRQIEVERALAGLPLEFVFNPAYASGIGSSLACALSQPALAAMDGVLVMLADMPLIQSSEIDALVDAFVEHAGRAVVRGASNGIPGHPVILPKSLFKKIRELTGDAGANQIIRSSGLRVQLCDLGDAALSDIDTVEDLALHGGVLTE